MNRTRNTFAFAISLVLIMMLAFTGCGKSDSSYTNPEKSKAMDNEKHIAKESKDTNFKKNTNTVKKVKLTVGSNVITAELEDNDSAKKLQELLQQGPITMSASNYGGFEKVCSLGTKLPSKDVEITAKAGDIMLYSSDQIVIFYGTNSFAYTKLAKVVEEDLDTLEEVLSGGESEVVLELVE